MWLISLAVCTLEEGKVIFCLSMAWLTSVWSMGRLPEEIQGHLESLACDGAQCRGNTVPWWYENATRELWCLLRTIELHTNAMPSNHLLYLSKLCSASQAAKTLPRYNVNASYATLPSNNPRFLVRSQFFKYVVQTLGSPCPFFVILFIRQRKESY